MNRRALSTSSPALPADEAAHVRAAEGWLELGDHAAALVELEKLAPLHRYHPEALKLRWCIYSRAERWEAAFQLADFMTRLPPVNDNVEPFLQRSIAASRMEGGGTDLAYTLLEEVCDRFLGEPAISFQLACYACQLGRLPEARVLLGIAVGMAEKCGEAARWRARALSEPALEPFWPELHA